MPRQSDPRKQAFFVAYSRHGNVRRAMRESGIGSPSTAYRWLAAMDRYGPSWLDLSPQPTRRVAPTIAESIIQLAESHPGWGKRRLAIEVVARHGPNAVSPNGVASVLRGAGLWLHSGVESATDAVLIDLEKLVEHCQRGVQFDLHGEPRHAVWLLESFVWRPLRRHIHLAPQLLQEPAIGSWLMRGLLQLGHALLDIERTRSALAVLSFLDTWLATEDAQPSPAQRAYQDLGRREIGPGETTWHLQSSIPGPSTSDLASVSLRTDDIWCETQQYLALVVRKDHPLLAVERLARTVGELERPGRWSFHPAQRAWYLGIINHDLASAQLQTTWPLLEIHRSLDRALDNFDPNPSPGMVASTWLHIATVAQRERRNAVGDRTWNGRIELALERALIAGAQEKSAILRSNVDLEVTEALLRHRPATREDASRIARVAAIAIEQGMSHRARTLLDNPLYLPLIHDFRARLEQLI